MAIIKLTRGYEATIDDDDLPIIQKHKWAATSGTRKHIYAVTMINGENGKRRLLPMHRLILFGYAHSPLHVDHKNGNCLDNRKSNIRACTCRENQQNVRVVQGKSRYKGVTWEGNRWRVRIRVNGKKLSVGSFDNEIDAAIAYDAAAIKNFGAFAATNANLIGIRVNGPRAIDTGYTAKVQKVQFARRGA